MADNVSRYGFRWYRSLTAHTGPVIEQGYIASGTAFNVNNGAQGVRLRMGDPVIRLDTGYFTLCDGTEGSGGVVVPYGIVMSIKSPVYNSAVGFALPQNYIASGATYTNVLTDGFEISICRLDTAIWEVDCDDAVLGANGTVWTGAAATSQTAWLGGQGLNVSHALKGASGELYANPKIDISTATTTSTLPFKIQKVNFDNLENVDYTGANVKILVTANAVQGEKAGVTGI